jgi:lipoyl(octanoyl) transferase
VTSEGDAGSGRSAGGAAPTPLEVVDLGRRSYEDVYALQQERLDARVRGEVSDALFLVEHDAVVTRGRRSSEGDTADVPFPVVSIERGGEATYHGPGQLVAYPIMLLPEGRRDLHRYLRDLESVVIETLRVLGIEGRREQGWTGVWIGDSKVCSIGVAVRRWVTWHGLAVNVTTDLGAFRTFEPCGLRPDVMTRVVDHLPASEVAPPAADELMRQTKSALVDAFRSTFGLG